MRQQLAEATAALQAEKQAKAAAVDRAEKAEKAEKAQRTAAADLERKRAEAATAAATELAAGACQASGPCRSGAEAAAHRTGLRCVWACAGFFPVRKQLTAQQAAAAEAEAQLQRLRSEHGDKLAATQRQLTSAQASLQAAVKEHAAALAAAEKRRADAEAEHARELAASRKQLQARTLPPSPPPTDMGP